MKKIEKYIYYYMSFAILGWLWEVIYRFIRSGILVNRGVCHGPWLSIFGIGGLLCLILFEKLKNNKLYIFITSMVVGFIVEYFGSILLEKMWGLRWWDYSKFFLNIDGRVCLKSILFFGIFGIIAAYLVIPLLKKIYKKYNGKIFKIVLIIAFSMYCCDFIYSNFINPNTGYKVTYNIKNS